jgi:hypothetical protein
MSKNLNTTHSIRELEAGLRDGRWIDEPDGDRLGVNVEAVREARRARRSRRVTAARDRLRRFSALERRR